MDRRRSDHSITLKGVWGVHREAVITHLFTIKVRSKYRLLPVGEECSFLQSKNDADYEFSSTPGNAISCLGDSAFPEAIELCALGQSHLTTSWALIGLGIWNKNSSLGVSISCLSWDQAL